MNAKYLALPLAALIPLCAQASPPEATSTVFVNCAHAHWPSRAQVARNLQVPRVTVGEPLAEPAPAPPAAASASDEVVRELQLFIRKEGRRYCMRGASHVQVDFHANRYRPVAMQTGAGGLP